MTPFDHCSEASTVLEFCAFSKFATIINELFLVAFATKILNLVVEGVLYKRFLILGNNIKRITEIQVNFTLF